MISVNHMEGNPVLVIKKKLASWDMEPHRKNGQNAAKLILEHVTCKGTWQVNGAWKVSVTS